MNPNYVPKTGLWLAIAFAIAVWLIVAFLVTSCAPKAYPVGPNPLDTPGDLEPTAAELHRKNIRQITGY